MPSNNIQALLPSIEKTFSDFSARVAEIEQRPGPRDAIVQGICDYVGHSISAESKMLLVSLCSKIEDEILASEAFKTTKRQNIFYRKNIRSLIYDKYNFATNETIDYSDAANKYITLSRVAVGAGAGSEGLGVIGLILSIALHKNIIIPIALLFVGGLFFYGSHLAKSKSQQEFSAAIQTYLESVKNGLISWLENIETFFYEQVEELKKSMEGASDE